jgi:L-ascorbate metabolism protein UlaG (beta-lactamase superfamily)
LEQLANSNEKEDISNAGMMKRILKALYKDTGVENTRQVIFTGFLVLIMDLIPAVLKDDDFLQDVFLKGKNMQKVNLWWLGQSGFLLQWNGIHVLIDPYLSDSLTRKYEGTVKPHIRMCEKVIAPARLNFIDIVTSSHNHTDHLDGETLADIINANPGIQMIIPEANRAFVTERLNMPLSFPIGLNEGEKTNIKGISFYGIPAAHNEVEKDADGHCRFMGYIIDCGGKKIYHSGDTLLYPGMAELLRPFKIDLAILPINGNDPSRGVAGNLDPEEAVELAHSINARIICLALIRQMFHCLPGHVMKRKFLIMFWL